MKVPIGPVNTKAEGFLPPAKPDASGVGINYADAYIRPIKLTLEDGRKVTCKRRGLKLTFTIGDRSGEALLRRQDHGPDEKTIVHTALEECTRAAGVRLFEEDGHLVLELE